LFCQSTRFSLQQHGNMKKVFLFLCLAFAANLAVRAQTTNSVPTAAQQNGFPQWLVVRILQEARPVLQPVTGLNLGQMIQAYRNGGLTISYICRDELDVCKGVYRVVAGGGDVTIVVVDSF
jgi:hypothetical protein